MTNINDLPVEGRKPYAWRTHSMKAHLAGVKAAAAARQELIDLHLLKSQQTVAELVTPPTTVATTEEQP